MFKKILATVLFTVLAVVAGLSEAQAHPKMGSDACQGALSTDKLVRVAVVKGDLAGCPAGSRSPYLCALHKAGLAHRSLGHAMRTTLTDLGDGTCGRVNLQGVIIYKADGKTLSGDRFVDPSRQLPVNNLRFGAWKTSVLYLAPVSGEEQLAACTSDLATCRAQVAKVAACRAGQLYDPATQTCVDKTATTRGDTAVARAAQSKCPECPKCAAKECPQAQGQDTTTVPRTGGDSLGVLTDCVTERDALLAQVNNLLPVTSKVAECRAAGHLYDPAKGVCVDTIQMSPMLATTIAESTARAGAELDRLRAVIQQARSCLGRYHWNSDTDGWCDTSRRW